MKKEKTRTLPYYEYYCDFCGEGPGDRSYVRDCYICGRDACPKCSKFWSEYLDEDHVHRWCIHCFKFAAKTGILEKIEGFRADYEEQVNGEIEKLRKYIKKRLL